MQTIEAEVVAGSIVMACPANETDTGAANYDTVRFNAMKHGILSRLAVSATKLTLTAGLNELWPCF